MATDTRETAPTRDEIAAMPDGWRKVYANRMLRMAERQVRRMEIPDDIWAWSQKMSGKKNPTSWIQGFLTGLIVERMRAERQDIPSDARDMLGEDTSGAVARS